MKFLISKSKLENMLNTLQPFLDKKDVSQITSHIYLKVENSKLILKSTDYEIGLEIDTDLIQIEKEGKTTSNGKKLAEIIKRLKDGDIILEYINNFLIITQQKSKFKLPTFDANEYPIFPNCKNRPIEINSIKLLKSIKKAIPAIDNNNPKFELNGALIDIKNDHINVVSTDTKRLSIIKIENQSEEEISLIVPKKALIEIQKIFFEDIELFFDEVNLIIKSKNYKFFTKLINGNFPNYERIIPKEIKYKLELPKKEIVESIKLITSISNDIKITIDNQKIVFESLNDENSEAKTELEFDSNIDEDVSIAVNSKYLTDFLSLIENEYFTLSINSNNTPFIIKSGNFQTIIMPIAI